MKLERCHSDSSNVRGGLVNHTKAAVWIAVHRMLPGALYDKFSQGNQDIIVASLIFHDMVKYGNPRANSKYTDGRHPLLVRAYVELCIENNIGKYNSEVLDMIEKMLAAIECHHGNWRNIYRSDEKLPEMQNSLHRFVHECDYLSSCKLFNFTGDRINA